MSKGIMKIGWSKIKGVAGTLGNVIVLMLFTLSLCGAVGAQEKAQVRDCEEVYFWGTANDGSDKKAVQLITWENVQPVGTTLFCAPPNPNNRGSLVFRNNCKESNELEYGALTDYRVGDEIYFMARKMSAIMVGGGAAPADSLLLELMDWTACNIYMRDCSMMGDIPDAMLLKKARIDAIEGQIIKATVTAVQTKKTVILGGATVSKNFKPAVITDFKIGEKVYVKYKEQQDKGVVIETLSNNSNRIGVAAKLVNTGDSMLVLEVITGGQADSMEIKVGDILLKVNGVEVKTEEELELAITKNSNVTINLKRGESVLEYPAEKK